MYLTAVNSGVRFPPPTRSQYSHLDKIEIPQASLDVYGGGGGIWDQQFRQPQDSHNNGYNSPFNGGSGSSNPFGQPQKQKSPAIQKLENDLEVFLQKIVDTEGRIKRGDMSRQTEEQIQTLRDFEPKLADLPVKLKAAGEYETADIAINVLQRLQACNELINGSRNGTTAHQGGNTFGGFDFGTPSSPQGGADFEAFNRAGGDKGFGNNRSGGSFDFGGQQKQTQPSGNIWESNFVQESKPSPPRANSGPFGPSNGQGGSFFGGKGFATSPFDSTPPKQNSAPVELDLLGIEEVKPKPTPVQAAPQQTQAGGIDLLGGGPVQPAATGFVAAGTNPFLVQGPVLGATPQVGVLGGQTVQTPLGIDPAQLRLMQINMMASPIAGNNMMGGAAMNPLLYQQMLLARQGMMGIPQQMPLGGVSGYGVGAQTPILGTVTMGGLQTGLGVGTAPAFGVNNTVSFTAENKAAQSNSSSKDPFSDLTTDLI